MAEEFKLEPSAPEAQAFCGIQVEKPVAQELRLRAKKPRWIWCKIGTAAIICGILGMIITSVVFFKSSGKTKNGTKAELKDKERYQNGTEFKSSGKAELKDKERYQNGTEFKSSGKTKNGTKTELKDTERHQNGTERQRIAPCVFDMKTKSGTKTGLKDYTTDDWLFLRILTQEALPIIADGTECDNDKLIKQLLKLATDGDDKKAKELDSDLNKEPVTAFTNWFYWAKDKLMSEMTDLQKSHMNRLFFTVMLAHWGRRDNNMMPQLTQVLSTCKSLNKVLAVLSDIKFDPDHYDDKRRSALKFLGADPKQANDVDDSFPWNSPLSTKQIVMVRNAEKQLQKYKWGLAWEQKDGDESWKVQKPMNVLNKFSLGGAWDVFKNEGFRKIGWFTSEEVVVISWTKFVQVRLCSGADHHVAMGLDLLTNVTKAMDAHNAMEDFIANFNNYQDGIKQRVKSEIDNKETQSENWSKGLETKSKKWGAKVVDNIISKFGN